MSWYTVRPMIEEILKSLGVGEEYSVTLKKKKKS